jgi:thioesterase domain-containing protein
VKSRCATCSCNRLQRNWLSYSIETCSHQTASRPSRRAGRQFSLYRGREGKDPRLARFMLQCESAIQVIPISYPDWPQMVHPSFDMNSLVAHSVDQIEAYAPSGPLLLAGYSLGGHVGYLAAVTLSAAGRSICFLGILDTSAEPHPTSPIRGARRLYYQLRTLMIAVRDGNAGEVLVRYVAKRIAGRRRRWIHRIAPPFARLRLPVRLSYHLNNHMRREQQLALVQSWLLQSASIARLIDVPTVLFRSDDNDADYPEDLGWRKRCSNLIVMPVPGTHRTMFEPPNLAILCDRFTSKATSRQGTSARHCQLNPSALSSSQPLTRSAGREMP